FFSSRSRHTRFSRDWSSDVCSSDLAKLFSLSARLPQFLDRFPDAQILYMARDPLAIIPSTMSLVTGPLDRAFGFWSKPVAEQRRSGARRVGEVRKYACWTSQAAEKN